MAAATTSSPKTSPHRTACWTSRSVRPVRSGRRRAGRTICGAFRTCPMTFSTAAFTAGSDMSAPSGAAKKTRAAAPLSPPVGNFSASRLLALTDSTPGMVREESAFFPNPSAMPPPMWPAGSARPPGQRHGGEPRSGPTGTGTCSQDASRSMGFSPVRHSWCRKGTTNGRLPFVVNKPLRFQLPAVAQSAYRTEGRQPTVRIVTSAAYTVRGVHR